MGVLYTIVKILSRGLENFTGIFIRLTENIRAYANLQGEKVENLLTGTGLVIIMKGEYCVSREEEDL
jgi:hypothetical protein